MTKRKPPKLPDLKVELTDQLMIYINYLLEGGLHGNDQQEVLQRMLCDGLRAAVPQTLVTQVASEMKRRAMGKSG